MTKKYHLLKPMLAYNINGGFCANTPMEFVNSIISINKDYSKKSKFIDEGQAYLKSCSTLLEL